MEPIRFTEQQLAALIAEMVAWTRSEREKHYPRGQPLTENERNKLTGFFSPEILESFRTRDLSQVPETIPYPPFYEKVRAGGTRMVPDAAHMTAMPFIDVALFNRPPTLRTIFHTLVHVTQYAVVGFERVMRGYFEVINESGLWMVVPYEEQAYQLDARFTADPASLFSVDQEVRDWMAAGKFA